MVTVVSGDTFSIREEAYALAELLGKKLKGKCGIIENGMFDVLIGMDFLSKSEFLVDFRNLLLINLEIDRPQSAPLFMMARLVEYQETNFFLLFVSCNAVSTPALFWQLYAFVHQNKLFPCYLDFGFAPKGRKMIVSR